MKTVLSLMGTILIFGISLSADRPVNTYAEYEKQLSDYQSRDQQLREQIAREQASILDVKKRIESSRKNIDELRRKKFEVLGVTPETVETAARSLDLFIRDVSILLNLPVDEFRNDSVKAAGCRAQLDTLLLNPAYRLKAFVSRTLSAGELVGEIEKRVRKIAADKVAAPAIVVPPAQQQAVAPTSTIPETASISPVGEVATYIVRKNGDRAETLFDIAQQVYGNAYLWPRIYQANKNKIDKKFDRYRQGPGKSHITDPSDLIFPGQVLVIPR